jgi:hypothetical protein
LSLALEGKEIDHMILALDLKIARFNLKTEELEWLATLKRGFLSTGAMMVNAMLKDGFG